MGFLGHNLVLSRASSFTTEFWLSRSLSHELFSFFMMEFWLSQSPSHELFSFFTMEFWLSQSPSHELFSFFTMEFWLSRSPSHELFSFFTMEFWLSRSPSHELFFFHDGILAVTIWGKTLFVYITKSIYIGSASLKTLPLDLEPPLQGKEYDPSYSNTTKKKES
jgi:hypothetical protein